jgi:hypothetical protein
VTSAFRHRVAIPNTADIDRVHAVEFLAAGVGGFCDRTLYAGVIESCARDWNDPGFLGEQPSQRDLSRCRLLLVRDLLKQIHQRLIRLSVLRVKPRDTVAEITKRVVITDDQNTRHTTGLARGNGNLRTLRTPLYRFKPPNSGIPWLPLLVGNDTLTTRGA